MSQQVAFEQLPFAGHYKLGVVRLAFPKALNALSFEMIAQIKRQLEAWQDDSDIAAIWLEGEGSKGFCAGGNVVDVYRSLAEQKDEGVFCYQYFNTEYQLDYLISTYTKPVICWGHGYVMGGGMGLFMASRYRLVMSSSRLAMPEIKIGLYPDVGASYFLNQLPEPYGRFLALTAYQVNAADACELGLATHYVDDGSAAGILDKLASGVLNDLSEDLVRNHIENAFNDALIASEVQRSERELTKLDHELSHLMEGDIATIAQVMQAFIPELESLKDARDNFLTGSALSACVIWQQLEWAKGQSLEAVFEREALLSLNCGLLGDFVEGVRALLIDKDRNPKWKFSTVSDVPSEYIERFFKAPENFPS